MGYYTSIDLFDVRLKPRCVEEVRRCIEGRFKGTEAFRYMLACLTIEPDGELVWYECSTGRWYRDADFVVWLAPRCEAGFVALWSQEGDGASWAYEFDGKGGVAPCSARRVAAMKRVVTRRLNRRTKPAT